MNKRFKRSHAANCQQKTTYYTRDEARKKKPIIERMLSKKLSVYRCTRCQHYHLGTRLKVFESAVDMDELVLRIPAVYVEDGRVCWGWVTGYGNHKIGSTEQTVVELDRINESFRQEVVEENGKNK